MKKILFAALLAVASATARAQLVAVSTDVLMDALLTPSVGGELVVGERTSIGLSLFGNHNPWGKTMKIMGLQPEWRYYFSGRPMHRHFVGIGGLGAQYDITWKGKVYDGSAAGIGLTFGYVLPPLEAPYLPSMPEEDDRPAWYTANYVAKMLLGHIMEESSDGWEFYQASKQYDHVEEKRD